jgi:CRP-like cAMP-binding protein
MGSKPSLFDNVDDDTAAGVVALAHRIGRKQGEWFFLEGDPAQEFFVLTSGHVKLTALTPGGDEITLRVLGAGGPFGAIAGLGPLHYGVSARALEPTEALAWTSGAMRTVLETNGILTLNALRLTAGRLCELQQRYCQLITEPAECRVARALLRLVDVGGRGGEAGIHVEFPVSRQDIAAMAGTSLFTVSRLLRSWERRGILQGKRRRIVLVEPRTLAAIAEGRWETGPPPNAREGPPSLR